MVRVALVLAMLAGCFMDSGSKGDDDSTATGTTSGASSGSEGESDSGSSSSDDGVVTGAGVCPPATECTIVPTGWGGPYLVAQSDVTCPPAAPELVGRLHGDPVTEVNCGCACGDATNTCAATLYLTPNDVECTTPDQTFPLAVGHCAVIDASRWAAISTGPTSAGSCTASAPANMPSVAWQRDAVMCVDPEPAACDGGTCVPRLEAPFVDVCIVRDGAHQCPADFIVGSTWFVDATDTRACECGCSSPAGVDCGLTLDVFNEDQCMQLYYESTGASCHHGVSVSAAWSLQWTPVAVGSCMPQQTVTGAITPTAERTLCCRG